MTDKNSNAAQKSTRAWYSDGSTWIIGFVALLCFIAQILYMMSLAADRAARSDVAAESPKN